MASLFTNLGANATLNVQAVASKVYSISCHNTNSSTRYFQLHDTATVPSAGNAPRFVIQVPPGATSLIGTDFFTNDGTIFYNGVAFGFSTTETTYTAGSAGDQTSMVIFT